MLTRRWSTQTTKQMNRPNRSILILTCFLLLLALLSSAGAREAGAQTEAPGWETPDNLSRSGSATDPSLVVDANGILHAIWKDEVDGYVYSRQGEEGWSQPVPTTLPFDPETTLELHLIPDVNNQVHAFWVDEEGVLSYSRVNADFFTIRVRWAPVIRLSTSAVDMAPFLDESGILHLAYARTLETEAFPAGVYYTRSTNSGFTWSQAQQLYGSTYFRNLTNDIANIQMTGQSEGETTWLYIAWDNQPRERLFMSRSIDGGETWEPARLIDGPELDPDTAKPLDVRIGVQGEEVLLVWDVGVPGETCTHHYQSSSNRGTTWTTGQSILPNFSGCLEDVQFLASESDLMTVLLRHRELPYLMAWDGSDWGSPLLQTELAEMEDPETLNQVVFGCLDAEQLTGSTYVIGCDEGVGSDIWISNRDLTAGVDWYPAPPTWRVPTTIAGSLPDQDEPVLVTDDQGRVHAFWSQPTPAQQGNGPRAIYYARLESGIWSTPNAILQSPNGDASQPSVHVDAQNRLHVVWTEGEIGALYYSWANAGLAVTASEWETPRSVPAPRPAASAPEIVIDGDGTFQIIYAIRLNENRGVYLVQSSDQGQSWSDPITIFDGEAAGWEMVDDPHVTRTGTSLHHALWTRSTLPGGEGASSLYYSRSEDGGAGWSFPEPVVNQPILWSQIQQTNFQVVHRIWQQRVFDRAAFRHQYSLDGGLIWVSPDSVSGLEELGPSALCVDALGHMHLLQITEESEGVPILRHWQWDGETWTPMENLNFEPDTIREVTRLAATVSPTGKLAVAIVGERLDATGDATENVMMFTERSLELPEDQSPTPLPTLTPTPQGTPTPDVTPGPSPTPTPGFEASSIEDGVQPGLISRLNLWAGPLIGALTAGLLIVVVFIVGLRARRG